MTNDVSLRNVGSQIADTFPSPENIQDLEKKAKSVTSVILQSPPVVIATTIGFSAAGYLTYWRYFKRIPTTAYLTPSVLRWRQTLVGRCTSVGDADGFRLYHTPGPPLYRSLIYGGSSEKSKKKAGQGNGKAVSHHLETLSIRLAGADAPESSHFGKPEQPMAREAKEELEKLVLGKQVWCQAAHVDQYQRLVSIFYVI
jgi:hypothetical protein